MSSQRSPKTVAPKTVAPKTAKIKTTAAKDPEARLRRTRRASMLLKHLSDPTRLQIVLMLDDGERHVGSLCEQLSQSQPAVSHHLALLRHGGIISPRRDGKNNYYHLTELGLELIHVAKTLME